MMMVMVVVRCSVCRAGGTLLCGCGVCGGRVIRCGSWVGGDCCVRGCGGCAGGRAMHCLGCCVEGVGLLGEGLGCLGLGLGLLCEGLEVVLLCGGLGVGLLVRGLGRVVCVGCVVDGSSGAAAGCSDGVVLEEGLRLLPCSVWTSLPDDDCLVV